MDNKELVALLSDVNGQLRLQEKAKANDIQSMIDFVRFCVLRKVWSDNRLESSEAKLKLFDGLMSLVVMEAMKQEAKENG